MMIMLGNHVLNLTIQISISIDLAQVPPLQNINEANIILNINIITINRNTMHGNRSMLNKQAIRWTNFTIAYTRVKNERWVESEASLTHRARSRPLRSLPHQNACKVHRVAVDDVARTTDRRQTLPIAGVALHIITLASVARSPFACVCLPSHFPAAVRPQRGENHLGRPYDAVVRKMSENDHRLNMFVYFGEWLMNT